MTNELCRMGEGLLYYYTRPKVGQKKIAVLDGLELTEEEYKKLKGVMWILRKNNKKLSDEESDVLNVLFNHSEALGKVYKLCNDLTAIFEEDIIKEKAASKINNWKLKVAESGLSCFKTFLTTLDKFYDSILNYFIDRKTSGFVEGLNNKIKVIKRRCYGIINIQHLYQRIRLDLEGYTKFSFSVE